MAAPTVMITGLDGFTGRYLRSECEAHGWQVVGCGAHAALARDPSYRQVDLLDAPALQEFVSEVQPAAVVHLAGIALVAHQAIDKFYTTHVLGTLNLLQALHGRARGVRKVLLASSASVYGNAAPGMYDETTPAQPANDYAVSKLAMEQMAWMWRRKLPLTIVRPFNYTGVGQSKEFLLPKIVDHYRRGARVIELGNTHVKRDFSDVRSVANAYRRLLEVPSAEGVVNVSSGQARSIQDVLGVMEGLAGYAMEVRVNDALVRCDEVEVLYGNCDKLKGLIGPYETVPLEATLRWMLESS